MHFAMSLMFAAFLISVAGSLLVALVYGLLFAQREDRVRAKLASMTRGWSRRRYVRAFVGAVRGKAATSDTQILSTLALVVLFFISVLFFAASREIGRQMASVERGLDALQAQIDGHPTKEPPPEAQLPALRAEANSLKPLVDWTVLIGKTVAIAGVAAANAGYLIWVPFMVMRRRFAHELDRFALRIQGLASKAELAQLALAESRVTDEASLKAFVEIAGAIAARQGVPDLVTTFDLW
jgi:hypothetical protein